jgi:hypothetical protein
MPMMGLRINVQDELTLLEYLSITYTPCMPSMLNLMFQRWSFCVRCADGWRCKPLVSAPGAPKSVYSLLIMPMPP